MDALISFSLLLALELVLGIDNVIFVSLISGRLPYKEQKKARNLGLLLALLTRLLFLASFLWILQLTNALFSIGEKSFSGKDLILIAGGLFLIAKSTHEIHQKFVSQNKKGTPKKTESFFFVIIQILLLDLVFSLDSVITAVGLVNQFWIIALAVIIATFIMILAANKIAHFVDRYPTIKMLALSFLILIGVALLGEGFGSKIPKGYIYFAMAYSLIVECLNLRFRKS